MMNKGHFDHALRFAQATAGFFAGVPLLVAEAEAFERSAEDLRGLWLDRGWDNREWVFLY